MGHENRPTAIARVATGVCAVLLAGTASACTGEGEPGAVGTASTAQLSPTYVLTGVNGRPLPTPFLLNAGVEFRVHADTLHFDTASATYLEVATVGARPTFTAAAESVTRRMSDARPFARVNEYTVELPLHLGIGRARGVLFDTGITVTQLGQSFRYALVPSIPLPTPDAAVAPVGRARRR